jgi:disulfide bond formation protein DsbB
MTPQLHALIVPLAAGAIVLNALAVALIVLFFLKGALANRARSVVVQFSGQSVFLLALLASAAALLIEAMGLPPCMLCWWQRIFLFPQVIVLGVAFIRKRDESDIAITLSVLGALVALYQHYLQFGGSALVPCGAGPDCSIRSVFEFGFVTLPWMAFSVFAVIILLLAHARRARTAQSA